MSILKVLYQANCLGLDSNSRARPKTPINCPYDDITSLTYVLRPFQEIVPEPKPFLYASIYIINLSE